MPQLILLVSLAFLSVIARASEDSGCSDLQKKIPLGQVGEFKIFAQETVGYEPDEDGKCNAEAAAVDSMDSIELIAQAKKKRVVETIVEMPSGYGSGDHSVSFAGASRKGDTFIVRYGEDGRWIDADTVITMSYVWNAKTQKFKKVGEDETSPAARAQDKMLAAVKAGNIARAKKMISSGEVETSPNGNTIIANSLANSIAEAAWRPMMEAYRKKNQAKVKEWLDFFGHTYRGKETCPFGFQDECYQGLWTDEAPELKKLAAIYNDFAFLLAENDDVATAEVIYREVLEHDPSRTVAYLNLADLLWKKGAKEEAGFYYRIYQRRLEVLSKVPVSAEVKERAATAAKEIKWSETEAAKLAGVEKLQLGGKPWPGFTRFAAIPADYLEFKKRDPNISSTEIYLVKRDFTFFGCPVKQGSELQFDTRLNLLRSTAGAEFEKNGITFQAGKPVACYEAFVESGTLAKDGEMDGFKLKGGTFAQFDHGKPSEFTLGEPQRIGMFTAAKNSLVKLNWHTLTLAEPITLRGLDLPAGTEVMLEYPSTLPTFKESDKTDVTLSLPAAREFPAHFKARWIKVRPDGFVEMAMLTENFAVDGKDCPAGASLRWLEEQKKFECRKDLGDSYWRF